MKTYHVGDIPVPALRGVNFQVDAGEFLLILGPSGAGKTTLLNLIGGIDNIDEGSILFSFNDNHRWNGVRDIAKMSDQELSVFRRTFVGFVFQFYNLLPNFTALENVELSARFGDQTKYRARKLSLEILHSVGLKGKERKYPRQLSGGEQQRVAIARALVKSPMVVLADEPTGNVDSVTSEAIYDVMSSFSEQGITFIIVTHDESMTKRAKRHLHLRDGVIIREDINGQ